MSVIDNDFPGMSDERLASLERYYMTLQAQRALTSVEAERLNALLAEQQRRYRERV